MFGCWHFFFFHFWICWLQNVAVGWWLTLSPYSEKWNEEPLLNKTLKKLIIINIQDFYMLEKCVYPDLSAAVREKQTDRQTERHYTLVNGTFTLCACHIWPFYILYLRLGAGQGHYHWSTFLSQLTGFVINIIISVCFNHKKTEISAERGLLFSEQWQISCSQTS